MGYTSYSSQDRSMRAQTSGYNTKAINDIFEQNKKRCIHESMIPKNINRECLDSKAHPNTIPIILSLDVTGSMGVIPHELVKSGLPKLMSSMIESGVKDASLLFVAVGDHNCDHYPFQVGQFESGDAELDLWLTRTYLEGGGGGNGGESYTLTWYFAANHTKLDSFNKRNQRGFLFTVGDEPHHDIIPKNAISEIYGDSVEVNLTANVLLNEVSKMYNVYHLHITETITGQNSISGWRQLLGENCIDVKNYTDLPKIISNIVISNIKTNNIINNKIETTKSEDIIL